MKKFTEKRIVITGAGSGLGRAIALEFAKLGWRICIAEINIERAEETLELVKELGGSGFVALCDVVSLHNINHLAESLEKKWGGVDIVVNNAGIAGAGFMEKTPIETWDLIMNVNLRSVVYGCRVFIPLLKKQGKGHIINIASYCGIACMPEMSCYNVSKAGVISLSETLKVELGANNIGVSVVIPSFFKSHLMEHSHVQDKRQMKAANALFEKTNSTANDVAKYIVKAVKKNKFYVLPQIDAKLIRFFKRMCPELYFKILSWLYKKGYGDKYLGLDKDSSNQN